MYSFVLVVHVLLATILVGLVLLQQGKGADMGAVMGSGGANSLFGVSGASSLLIKLTTSVAVLFMLTSLLLVRFHATGAAGGGRGSVSDPLKGSALEGVTTESPAEASPVAVATQSTTTTTPTSPVVDPSPLAVVPPAPAATAPAVAPVGITPTTSSGM